MQDVPTYVVYLFTAVYACIGCPGIFAYTSLGVLKFHFQQHIFITIPLKLRCDVVTDLNTLSIKSHQARTAVFFCNFVT